MTADGRGPGVGCRVNNEPELAMNPILEHVRDHLLKFTLVPHVLGDGEAMAVQVTLTHVVSTLVFQADMDPPLLSV